MRYVKINGVTFKVRRSKKFEPTEQNRTLEDCYDKPSKAKQRIWYDWREWFLSSDELYRMTVRGFNSQTFSIQFTYVNPDTMEIIGYAVITKENNVLYI